MRERLALVAALSLLLASCAGCDSGETALKSRQLTKVTCLLDWKASMQNAAFYLAKSRGYYKEAGLDVAISEGNGAPEATTLIGNGTYNVGISSGAATVMAVAKGAPVVCIAQMYQRTPTVIYSFADQGIREPKDLYGKIVGVNHDSINADEFRAFLRSTELDSSKIKTVAVSWGADPILSGNVSALLDYADNEPVILAVRTGKKVNSLYLADYGVDAYGLNIISNKSFIDNHPAVIAAFVKATLRAWGELINDPERAAKEFSTLQPTRNLEADTLSAKIVGQLCTSDDTKWHGLGYQTEKKWSGTVSTLKKLALIQTDVAAKDLFTNKFLGGTTER